MSYKICATKKDLDSISRNLQSFDPNLWEVKVASGNYAGIYQIVEDSGVYHLYQDGTDSNKTVSISFIRGLVYEGQQVNVNTGSSFAFGALTKIGYTQQKAATKNATISEGLRLQGESANYVQNRLVREEDIKAPTTVYFWYDSRYLKAEVIRNNGYNRIPMRQIDEGMAERIPGVEVSSADQKNLCNIGMSCTVGEIIRITKSDNSDYLIHLDSIVGYDSLENITLPNMTEEGIDLKLDGEDGFFEFVIQQDCFATFSVPTTNYGLWVQNYTISSQSAYTVDLTAVIEEQQYSLYSGSDDLQGNHVSETPIIQVAEGKVVDLLLSVNMANDYTVEKFELLNITSGEITQLVLDDNNHAQFVMPSSLCAITLVIVEAESEPVQPITNAYVLTIQSPTLSQVTVNGNVVPVPGTVEFTTTGNKTATANVVWEPSIKSISKVSVYPTGGSPTPAMIKKQKTTDTTIQLGKNMTLEIVTNPISCEYTHINGAISDLSKNSKWSSDNKVVDVVGGSNGDLYEYYNTTETTISNTPNNNPFAEEDVVDVAFYTDQSHFGFTNSSFRDCDSLKKVSVSGPSTIAVDTNTFRNSALKELVGQEKITYLGRASFLGTNLQSFENNNISAIPDLTFNSSALKSINLASAPLTSIGEQVFDNCKRLKHVWLPKTLSYLGAQCFGETAIQAVQTYPTYTEVSAPINSTLKFIVDGDYKNGLTVLPKYTFEFCDKLEEAYLPASITHIEKGAFHSCNNLKHFAAPGLKTIEQGAFQNTWIEDFYRYNELEDSYHNSVVNQYIRQKPGTSGIYFDFSRNGDNDVYLTCIRTSSKDEKYILYKRHGQVNSTIKPSLDVISISDYGFSRKENMLDPTYFVYLQDCVDLTHIGHHAFENTNISSIHLPTAGRITELGEGAFKNCKHLSYVINFEKQNITKISKELFYNCGTNVKGIGATLDPQFDLMASNVEFYIPYTTTEIGDYAFAECPQLMGIANLADCKILKVGDYAFKNCFKNTAYETLEGWRIAGMSVAVLAALVAFSFGIAGMVASTAVAETASTMIWLGAVMKTSTVNTIGGVLVAAGCGLTIFDFVHFMGLPKRWKKNLKNSSCVTLSHTKFLGQGAFQNCKHLGLITLNKDITDIHDDTFNTCKKLGIIQFADTDGDESDSTTLVGVAPSLNRIGKRAFKNCKNLLDASLTTLLAKVETIDDDAFNGAKIHYREDDGFDSIVMSPNLKKLGKNSLYFDSPLHLVFPMTDLSNLEVDDKVFNTSQDIYLTIPESAVSQYKTKFKQLSDENFIIVRNSDPGWLRLKELGYNMDWVVGNATGMSAVDLGLSVKWGSCNVNAITYNDLGSPYSWASPMLQIEYSPDTYPEGAADREVTEEYDIATCMYGSGWRTPSKEQFEELITKCQWEWIRNDDFIGYKITGPNGNSIFLPRTNFSYPKKDTTEEDSLLNTSTCRTLSRDEYGSPVIFQFASDRIEFNFSQAWQGSYVRPVYIGD